MQTLAIGSAVHCVDVGPDDESMLVASNAGLALWSSGGAKRADVGSSRFMRRGFLSPDAGHVVAVGDGVALLLQHTDGKWVDGAALDHGDRYVCSAAFSHTGGDVATCCENGSVDVWRGGASVMSMSPHARRVVHVAFSGDDTTLLTAS